MRGLKVVFEGSLIITLLSSGCYDDLWTTDYIESESGRQKKDTSDVDASKEETDRDAGVDTDEDTLQYIVADGSWCTVSLLGPPLAFAPTSDSVRINVVVESGNRGLLSMSLRRKGEDVWRRTAAPAMVGEDIVEWHLEGLDAGTRYEYSIYYPLENGDALEQYRGEVTTRRPPGEAFSFAMITDSHVHTDEYISDTRYLNTVEATLLRIGEEMLSTESYDFIFHLGDIIDFHQYGFVVAPPDGTSTRFGYLNYRSFFGDPLGRASHFMVIGNWEGENGHFTDEQVVYSRAERLAYIPGPEPGTYDEGGSPAEDYYAFTWGDALFVVLNVMTYTPTAHLLSSYPGVPDDWTLGEEQMTWFEDTLENTSAKWRFVFIHHPVGGNAGDPTNSAYGRGGGRAAYVGEQAIVHQIMLDHGVQVFFYGHDHVFTDMVVDGIHYTLPGSAGAPWKFESDLTGYEEGTYWTDSGYAMCDVTTKSVAVRFVNTEGTELYSYTIEP
jgi:predicted phosphodiesterase